MYKMILQDYRSHLKSALKNVWDNSAFSILLLLYCTFGTTISEDKDLSYFAIVIPSLLAYILSRMYGGRLNKTFFLCPLDSTARKRYAVLSFRLRIIIPTILFVISNIFLMLYGFFAIDIFAIRMLIFLCTAISVNIYARPNYSNAWTNTTVYPFVGNYSTINTYSNAINIIVSIIVVNMNEYSIYLLSKWEIVLIAFCVILQVALTLCKIKRFYWQSILLMEFYQ